MNTLICQSSSWLSGLLTVRARSGALALLALGMALSASGLPPIAAHYTGAAVNFGAVNVGSTSAATALTFTFDTAGTLGNTAVLTQGIPGLDFSNAGTGTCLAATAYTATQTCTINVKFTPRSAGDRYGAAELLNQAGAVIATGFVYGKGVGPQAVLYPGAHSTIGSGFNSPSSVVVDAQGNLYIADTANNRVLKETLSGATYIQTTIGSGFNYDTGVALDGAGNVYVADTNNNRLVKETLSAGVYTQSVITVSGSSGPAGLAVDGSGNLYVANCNSSAVLKGTLSGSTYTASTVGSGFSCPQDVVVDASGNIFVADTNNNRVVKETLSAGVYAQSVVGSGMNNPYGVGLDGSGDLYVADYGSGNVYMETRSGSTYTQTTVASSLIGPNSVAVDAAGNLYVAEYDGNLAIKVDVADPPTLTFATTAVGSTSTDSPQTRTLVNIGNAALTFSVPGAGNNPAISTNFSLNSVGVGACPLTATGASTPGSLALAASCSLPISFKPTVQANFGGSLVFTDNNLNVAGATQTIFLNGMVTPVSQLITFLQPTSPVTNGVAPITLSATASSGLTVVFSIVSGPGTISGATLTITGTGTVVVAANQPGNASYLAAAQVTRSVVVNQLPTISFTVAAHNTSSAPFIVAATSNSAGAITYSVVSGPATISGATVTLSGTLGTVVLQASQAASGGFGPGTQTASFTVFGGSVWLGNTNSSLSAFDPTGAALSPAGGYTGGGLATIPAGQGMAFDNAGNVWIANSGNTGISNFFRTGAAVTNTPYTGGGVSNPLALAVDGLGQVWIVNADCSLSALTNAGIALTPETGYTGAGTGTAGGMAIDLSGDVWISNSTGDTVTEFIGVAAPVAPLSTSLTNGTTGVRP